MHIMNILCGYETLVLSEFNLQLHFINYVAYDDVSSESAQHSRAELYLLGQQCLYL